MNSAKYESKRKGLNSALTKVFDATPIAEAWSGTAIALEMRRCGTGGVDSRATLGCLNSLVEYGLVEEIGRGQFRRVEIRERLTVSDLQIPLAETVIQEPEMQIKPLSTQTVCSSPIDKLSKLASRLRDLANDMETAALELAEQAERNESETAKMRQLQTLLKSLG